MKLGDVPGSSKLARFAERDYQGVETNLFNKFVTHTREDFKINQGDFGIAPWNYEGGFATVLNKGNVVSITGGCYTYMGGAHGLGVARTYNYGLVGGKPKRLTLWDIVQKSSRQEIRLMLLGKASANPNTDWIQDGIYNDFTEDQLNRFWIAPDALVFEFNPYELGSYAAGAFTFRLTYAELKSVLRPNNPLKAIIRP